MADNCEDPELRTGLTQARKKPRNFCLIAKGTTAAKLIVSKKLIKAGDVQKAKAEAKGNLVIEGVCQGEGAEMVFQVVGDEPTVKALTIKELIAEQTGLTLKARFAVVNELPAVEEEENEAESSEEGTAAGQIPEAPPLAPPVEATANDKVAQAIAQLTAAMNKLSPVIQAAVKSSPNRRDELVQGIATFKAQIQAQEVENAKTTLLAVGKLAKELSAAPPQAPPPPPTSTNEQADQNKAAQWQAEWGALEPKYLAALEAASNDLAGKLKVIHAYATEQAEAAQYDKALTALGRLRPLIDQAGKENGGADKGEGSGNANEFQALFEEVEPRYLEILRQNPDNAGELRGVMDFANGNAEDDKFDKAIAALNKLSGLLDKTEETLLEETIDAQIDEEDTGRGVVAFRKALLSWDAARNSAFAEIRSLQAKVIEKYPDADVERLGEIFERLDESLHDALVDCINAEDQEDRQHYNSLALNVVRDFESRIDGDELIGGVDSNPFAKVAVGNTLKKALGQVATFLT
jgi:hypothetical protein